MNIMIFANELCAASYFYYYYYYCYALFEFYWIFDYFHEIQSFRNVLFSSPNPLSFHNSISSDSIDIHIHFYRCRKPSNISFTPTAFRFHSMWSVTPQLDLAMKECIILMRLNYINLPQSVLNLLNISESLWVCFYLYTYVICMSPHQSICVVLAVVSHDF